MPTASLPLTLQRVQLQQLRVFGQKLLPRVVYTRQEAQSVPGADALSYKTKNISGMLDSKVIRVNDQDSIHGEP